ncbi:diguanylate cyclase [Salinispirillum sp. LH 10-3-1]|uniref:Diguanylate cyclase n=1 Tax=Salinispirillum sp. LH 10-3-1 TaxID=2952525 RepID=A0AB38YK91_9GAMM
MTKGITQKQSSQRRSVVLIIGGLVLMWLLTASILAAFYRTSVDNFSAEAKDRILVNTQYFARNQSQLTNAKLNELDSTLRALSYIASAPGIPDQDIQGIFLLRRQVSPEIADFLLLDPSGQIRIWTRGNDEPVPEVSDRGYFRVHLEQPSEQTFLSSPDLARTTESRPFIALSRGLYSPDGEFLGVLAMALDIERLANTLGGVTEIDGVSTVLADLYGSLLFRRPFREYEPGQTLESIAGYGGNPPERASFVVDSPFDGVTRQVSFQRLENWPWVAFVGADLATPKAAIERFQFTERLRLIVLLGVFSVMFASVAWLTWRRMQSEQALMDDIVQRKAVEERLAWQANHDALTGLPNRMLFYDRLNHTLRRSSRSRRSFGLIYIDLDGFKAVNDQWGHTAGDQLLQEVAKRLQDSVRGSDTVARLAGDEFVILADQCGLEEAQALAEKVLSALTETIVLPEQEVNISASIGLAVAPLDGDSADGLIKAADKAMYFAKNTGKGKVAKTGDVVGPSIA